MADRIQIRRDTASNWASANPTLAQGELALETDTQKIKAGDGTTVWSSLSYYTLGIAGFSASNITGTISQAQLAAEAVNESKMQVSNTPTNGHVLTAQSGVSGGMKWEEASVPTSNITGTISQAQLAAEAVNESKMQVSNTPTNGHVLTAQSGVSGGMKWEEGSSGGSMVFIASSGVISFNTASATFTGFNESKFDHYVFMLQHVLPVTGSVKLVCQTSTNGGSSFSSTSGGYHSTGNIDQVGLIVSDSLGNTANDFGVSGRFELYAPHMVDYTYSLSSVTYMNSSSVVSGNSEFVGGSSSIGGNSARLSAEDVDAVRFIFTSGGIKSGEIVMYGIANA